MLNENALRLLQITGERGHWTLDLLFESSALPFRELQHAILLLELERVCGGEAAKSIPFDGGSVPRVGEQAGAPHG
jgi:hypothetical protein